MKRSPLNRKTPLARGKKGLKRTRIRQVSAQRRTENAAYNIRVLAWKLEHPWCKACFPIAVFLEIHWANVAPTKDCHHMAGKEGKLLMDEKWWLPVCRKCHDWIGDHSNAARELGLLAPKCM
jgi:hypothetical protein